MALVELSILTSGITHLAKLAHDQFYIGSFLCSVQPSFACPENSVPSLKCSELDETV